ncbi:hydrolase (HAD superfamily) [Teratosphaeria destructans]|uniref:Hydrolase (HAD superfamily) n=1 Tax=Teratosphaeria destructans TaxID=418781 RepID=A0A9W7SRA3_9PEZI|nr:hydrolase (HAD superfamily) [Teratosphaeria destructans]
MAFTTASNITFSRVKALSFDIYGTLIDWENGIADSARATALGPYLPTDHKTLLLDIEKHDTTVQRQHPRWKQTEIIAEGLRRYAQELGIVDSGKLSQRQVDEAAQEYASKIGDYPAFADSVEAMKRLGQQFKLIALSNVDRSSFSKTLSGSLKGVEFDAVYTAEDIGSYKPDPANFRYLLDHVKSDFGIEQAELVHVAQSLFHDHGPASEFQLQSVWVDRKGFMGGDPGENTQEKFAYQLRLETLGELANIVEAALSVS